MRNGKANAVERPVAIVVGADDVGSAVAVALHRSGFATVICDDIDPPWARRGMSFTNAWYFGNAELDGEAAVFCASAKSISPVLRRDGLIAATSWSWHGIAPALAPVAIVRSGSTSRRGGRALKARAPEGAVTIGIGRDYVSGVDVDVVIPSDPEGPTGAIITGQTTAFEAGTTDLVGAVDQGPLVYAPKAGRFATNRRIGDLVRRRELVGAIGNVDVVAPISGALRGLSSRGAAIFEGAMVLEVDPRGDPVLCFGIDERAGRIARRVVSALTQHLRSAMPEPERGVAANVVPAA